MPTGRQTPARPKRARTQSPQPESAPRLDRIERFADRHASRLAIALILVGSLRIAATYTVFNHTSDEPAHIACGMQWLDQHIYEYEHQHPPLTRVMVAIGPYLAGARGNRQNDMTIEGDTILYGGNHYDLRLALSRAGNLPFFWLACWMVFLWGRKLLNDAGAVVAVLIFTMIPTVLAHAGLSTTDMGVTACLTAALYAFLRFVESPNARTAAWLGVAGGLTILTKFSALVYFPAAIALTAAVWIYRARPSVGPLMCDIRSRIPGAAISLILAFFIIWAGYRFSFGRAPGLPLRTPFPELFSGVQAVMRHNAEGHLAYLLGQLRMDGWWYFFPVVLAVKLPLALLGLIAIGLVAAMMSRIGHPGEFPSAWPFWIAIAMPLAMLIVAMSAHINIGLRHILPIFPFLALIGACGAIWLARSGARNAWARWTLAAAVIWLCGTSLAAHPDYLPYFNAIAGNDPERIVVDSDLDWGQDIKRLGARLRELNAEFVTFTPTITTSLSLHGFPPHQQSAWDGPDPGWNAVQISEWKLYRMGLQMRQPGAKTWPDVIQPTERVGRSILLYHVPGRN